MESTTIITKQETLYGAYAPDFGVTAWGHCRDEALNNLSSELQRQGAAIPQTAMRAVQKTLLS
jgi:hypothetical protein